MKIYRDINDFKNIDHPVVTIGTFDGVHIGHKKIIKRLIDIAKKEHGQTVIITFYPHPRTVLRLDEMDLKFINTQKEKIKIFEKAGIDNLVIYPFTKEFSKMNADDFVKNILIDKIHTKKLVIGYDHRFGNQRKGNIKRLFELSHIYNFEVEEIPEQDIKNIAVSSTKIRKALRTKDIKQANVFLGYEYSLSGIVVHGNKIGRTIGYPTANIEVDDKNKLIPANGVYSVKVEWKGKLYKGMCNIGVRPTIDHGKLTIEANIFDFDKDIYGDILTIYFVDYIRDERRFVDLDSLKNQLAYDKQRILRMFEKLKS